MQRKRRNPDRYRVGRSSIVPYISSESWKQRHKRRMETAFQNKDKLQEWCNKHRWKMRIANDGYHWIFYTNENKIIEWFPSTGKLAIGKKWKEGIHCHDYEQLLKVFEIIGDK